MDSRHDASDKTSGKTIYAGDVAAVGMTHAAVVRSGVAHGNIVEIDTSEARALPGVIGVFTAADVSERLYGRAIRDIPILAQRKVRFIGERVAAVVAESREQAEAAALRVQVEYEELPAVTDAADAVEADAPLVHEAPWTYSRSSISAEWGANLQSWIEEGEKSLTDERLQRAEHVIDETYVTPSGHQGYIEPHVCLAHIGEDGLVHVWAADKGPYAMRDEVAACLELRREQIVVHPVAIGGDFGGKGTFGDVPLCVELARLTGKPVRLALRYWEDLTATDPRHPAHIRVRVGCDDDGKLRGLSVEALLNGGAYAGYKPRPDGSVHGVAMGGSSYRIPAMYCDMRIAYTNSVPRGHMRAPGSPQVSFAVESALDELARQADIDPVELRRRNLLTQGEPSPQGSVWVEARGLETLEAALSEASDIPPAPEGWLTGQGIAVYDRPTTGRMKTSIRVSEEAGGSLSVEVPVPETGTGSHTFVREQLAKGLGIERSMVAVRHVPTSDLDYDRGAGGSRVTVSLGVAVAKAVEAWADRGAETSVTVLIEENDPSSVTSYCVQVATVGVDPVTGQIKVLQLVTAVDVADIINPAAHMMQIEGGAVMGYGFACLEDLHIEEGQVWAGNLGEFKLPSIRDVPTLRTVLVDGGTGVGPYNVKAIGEVTNIPTAAAIANAVADASGVRLRALPLRAEDVWSALREGESMALHG